MIKDITAANLLVYLASKSDKEEFIITYKELYRFGSIVEKQDTSYRAEISNWEAVRSLKTIIPWAPRCLSLYNDGIYEFDEVRVDKKHKLWDYICNRHLMKSELNNFDKAYEIWRNERTQ